MEKIKNLLIPQLKRPERWWHRFVGVLIYGSTIVIFIFSLLFFVGDSSWREFSYAYNFESGYTLFDGTVEECNFYINPISNYASIRNCGDINTSEFLERYTLARGTYEKLSEARSKGYSDNQIVFTYLNHLKDGKFNGEVIESKTHMEIKYSTLFAFLGILLGIAIGWFIFWYSIVYRVILYIIYGKQK